MQPFLRVFEKTHDFALKNVEMHDFMRKHEEKLEKASKKPQFRQKNGVELLQYERNLYKIISYDLIL